ncbi:hypothetical protein BC629DRAFT_1588654 [Irpex lacteus]|nr:hypothetical protein BC629DRAFT_1588654 [Irpex lacteus]
MAHPLIYLPEELVLHILQHDDVNNSIINGLSLVSHEWNEAFRHLRWGTLTCSGFSSAAKWDIFMRKLRSHPEKAANVQNWLVAVTEYSNTIGPTTICYEKLAQALAYLPNCQHLSVKGVLWTSSDLVYMPFESHPTNTSTSRSWRSIVLTDIFDADNCIFSGLPRIAHAIGSLAVDHVTVNRRPVRPQLPVDGAMPFDNRSAPAPMCHTSVLPCKVSQYTTDMCFNPILETDLLAPLHMVMPANVHTCELKRLRPECTYVAQSLIDACSSTLRELTLSCARSEGLFAQRHSWYSLIFTKCSRLTQFSITLPSIPETIGAPGLETLLCTMPISLQYLRVRVLNIKATTLDWSSCARLFTVKEHAGLTGVTIEVDDLDCDSTHALRVAWENNLGERVRVKGF